MVADTGVLVGTDAMDAQRSVLSTLDWVVIVVHMVLTVGVGAAISYFAPATTPASAESTGEQSIVILDSRGIL